MKKLLVFGGLIFGAFALLGGKKAYTTKNIADQLQMQLRGITGIPEFFGLNVRTAINVAVINPTDTPFSVSTAGLIRITKIRIFNKEGKLAGEASPNIDNISIPARSEIVLKNIPVQSNLPGLINTLLIGSFKPEDYTIQADISAFGTTFTV